MIKKLVFILSCIFTNKGQSILEVNATLECTSPVYCNGAMLKKIQLSPHIDDNKYFVDMATARPLSQILRKFKKLPEYPNIKELTEFLNDNFYVPGQELENVLVDPYPLVPAFTEYISNPIMRHFAQTIHKTWQSLVRRYNPERICKFCQSSLLPIQYPFVVPGGRFREFYYWDSFFVMEGLNLGSLFHLTKNMLKNFLDLVETYGMIPNGARRYMLNRSQPPLLSPSVEHYIKSSGDEQFLQTAINTLDKEYNYWISNHSVKVVCPPSFENCYLTRYVVKSNHPRPESYREDLITVEFANGLSDDEKKVLYGDLAAGAESGWDYSSRWVPDASKLVGSTQEKILRGIRTSHILPVDLNSIMYLNERTLARLHRKLAGAPPKGGCRSNQSKHHVKKAEQYDLAANVRAATMEFYMWDFDSHSFYDYDIGSENQIRRFSLSNYFPFWTDALTADFKSEKNHFIKPFKNFRNVAEKYLGATPTSELQSKLQWDFPNSWAPLEYVVVEGLLKAADSLETLDDYQESQVLRDQAYKVAEKFVQSSLCAWYSTGGEVPGVLDRLPVRNNDLHGSLFEKYNVTKLGLTGGGGEYTVQTGFGWTNGVILHFLNKFPHIKPPAQLRHCLFPVAIPDYELKFGTNVTFAFP